jgi:hypothetical protein
VERQAAAMTRVAGWNGDPTVGPAMEPWRMKKKKKPKNFIFKLKTMEGNSKCKEIGIFELFEHKKSRARHVAHFPSI